MQLSFTVLKLWYFLYRYKNPYFKNLSKYGRNSIVNISKTKSRRYIFLCIFGKSMSKLTKSRIFTNKSFGNPYCIVFPGLTVRRGSWNVCSLVLVTPRIFLFDIKQKIPRGHEYQTKTYDDLGYKHFQRASESLDVSISLELSRFLSYIEISNLFFFYHTHTRKFKPSWLKWRRRVRIIRIYSNVPFVWTLFRYQNIFRVYTHFVNLVSRLLFHLLSKVKVQQIISNVPFVGELWHWET